MLHLRTFGGLALQREGTALDPVNSQRKALALLAVLGSVGARGIGRDKLLLLLWPESDADRARGALKQMLHTLRRQLGSAEAILGTAELRLNPELIESDLTRFRAAIDMGDPEAAVALYHGPFLDGVHLDGAPEFDEWLEQQRAGLERSYQEALKRLACAAEAGGDPERAVVWWRRLQAADPLNGRVAIRLMQAMEASGDRAAALRHARVHELLLREELGIVPDPEVVALAADLRANGREPTAVDLSTLSTPRAAAAASDLPAVPVAVGEGDRVDAERGRPGAGTPHAGHRGPIAVALLIAAVVAGATLVLASGRGEPDSRSDSAGPDDTAVTLPAQPSIAVLPFVDLSPEGNQEYLADGIAEEILNALAQVPELRVPARTSSFYFKSRNVPVREIARQLGVATVLEGGVRREGDRVRITVQLIDARADSHLWSHTFDREMRDVFAIQSEIARTVADALEVRLAADNRLAASRSPASLAAHDLFLQGLFHWNRRSAPELERAIQLFEQAARADPSYARAHAGLALAYAVLPIAFASSPLAADAFAKAEAAAGRALALDPSLGEAHAARGYAYRWQWRWAEAFRELERAVAISPANATARQWYGEQLVTLGRGHEGEAEIRRAIALDPLSLVAHHNLGLVLVQNRRYAEAISQLERTHRMDPGFALPLYVLQRGYLLTGRTEDAMRAGRLWAELTGAADPGEVETLVRATLGGADRLAALEILARWERAPSPRWPDIAFYYTSLDERDRAITALEQGARERLPMMVQLVRAPWFDPLRDDPRVVRILREMGFPG